MKSQTSCFVNNEFGTLKRVVVGTELNFTKRQMDFTFRNMFKENLKLDSIYNNIFENYELNYELVQERIQDLDNLAKVLEDRGIEVIRPDTYELPNYFDYNGKNQIKSAASNVRDITLTYKDLVIETQISVINRLHENELFMDKVKNRIQGNKFIKMPIMPITNSAIDSGEWLNVQERIRKMTGEEALNLMPYMDAANIIKINDDIICNIGSINQWKSSQLLENIIKTYYPNIEFHRMFIADSHIDGTLIPLKEGVFLVNERFLNTDYIKSSLPEKFQNWTLIYAQDTYEEDRKYWDNISKNPIALASSRGMDINVLSLNRSEVLINDDAVRTADLLYKHYFQPIPIKFRHGEIFAGGIHCSTLDLERGS